MNISLKNKTAIITGSVQGIGKQTAKRLLEAGASVVINNYTDEAALQKTADELGAFGPVKAVIADVTKENEAKKLIDAALELGSTIDILINNAGGLVKRVPIAEYNEEHFDTVMNVNLKSAFIMAKLVAPFMKKQQSGKIINLSSQAAHDGGGPGAAAYAASKGAVWTFTKSLAKELGPHVTVNCLSPGFIDNTTFHTTFTPEDARKSMPSKILLGRAGAGDDIAKVALFLASELADYLTGQSLEINGGLYMP
ncbi:MAG: glucose 1-dehydrogenase [Calditrichaeota bacterium]|nr:MAG: SDR family NAD(P)-dependent oxidoreductase [Calditrichota bacterium]MBL1208105.1 glucose 1-dehydrogenase [Calditrichota bacterium]NOG47943.1 glucose 1-dehydrogenase [Calditrichota bacterium]